MAHRTCCPSAGDWLKLHGFSFQKGETKVIRFLTCATLLALALTGCSSTDVVRAPLDVTIGQQLIDLKQAHTNGALSNSEYDDQRRRLINSVQ